MTSSNSQAEQLAIIRALEQIQNLHLTESAEKTVVISRQQSETRHTAD